MSMWHIECIGEKEDLEIFMGSLDSFSKAISFFKQENSPQWRLEALCESPSAVTDIKDQFETLAASHKIPYPLLSVDKLPEKDWLAENRQAFPALNVGKFYIHGSHIK